MSSLKEKRQSRLNKLLMEKFNLIPEEVSGDMEGQIRSFVSQNSIESRKKAAELMRGNAELIKKFATSENKVDVGVAAMAYPIEYSPDYGGRTAFLTQVSMGMDFKNWGNNKSRRQWEDSIDEVSFEQASENAKNILKSKYGLSPDGGIATDESDLEGWLREKFEIPYEYLDETTGEMVKSEFLPDTPANLKAWKKLGSDFMSYLPGIPGIGDLVDYFYGQSDGEWGKPGYYSALAKEDKAKKAAIVDHYNFLIEQGQKILAAPNPHEYGIDPGETHGYFSPFGESGNYWLLDPNMERFGPRGFDYASRKDWEFRKKTLEGVKIDREDDLDKIRSELEIEDKEIIPSMPWWGESYPVEYLANVKAFKATATPGSAKYISPLPADFKKYGSGFGMRILKPGAKGRPHTGIDVGAATGTPIQAVGDGVITRVQSNSSTAGNFINLTSADGKYKFRMLHMSKFGKFKLGDRVKQGDIIGYVGNTGTSTSPHLHFDVIDLKGGGLHMDPVMWYAKETGTEMAGRSGERGRQRYIDKHGSERAEKDLQKQLKGVYGRGYDSGFGPEYFESPGVS